ncbi:MAG: hypothetical protein ACK4F7_09570 [Inhella sp.]
MPMHALNLYSDPQPRFAAALSFGIASPLPSQHCAPPAEQAALYDLLPADEAPALELAATEAAWAPTERLGL